MNFLQTFDKLYLAIVIFLSLYLIVVSIRPDFIFDNKKNTLRQFGVGYKNTTILTLWIVTILLAIFSYFIVIYIHYIKNMWY